MGDYHTPNPSQFRQNFVVLAWRSVYVSSRKTSIDQRNLSEMARGNLIPIYLAVKPIEYQQLQQQAAKYQCSITDVVRAMLTGNISDSEFRLNPWLRTDPTKDSVALSVVENAVSSSSE